MACLKSYRKEINARNYFLQIDWVSASMLQKVMYLFNFTYLLWILEAAFEKYETYLRKPKMLALSQCCFIVAAILMSSHTQCLAMNIVFTFCGGLNFIVGILLVLAVIFLIPFSRYVYKKRAHRKMLVN